jgi:hypothetical protein
MVAAHTCAGKGPDVAQKQFVERPTDVRFTPNSGHVQCNSVCPLCANSGHDPMIVVIWCSFFVAGSAA